MAPLRPVLAAAVLAALALARPASPDGDRLGADWLVDPEAGALQLTLAADTRLARRITLGARFGMMYLPEPDGSARDRRPPPDRSGRLYAEGSSALVRLRRRRLAPAARRVRVRLLTRTLSFGSRWLARSHLDGGGAVAFRSERTRCFERLRRRAAPWRGAGCVRHRQPGAGHASGRSAGKDHGERRPKWGPDVP